MLNIAASDDLTGVGHPHSPELIMHWIDVCTDPVAHSVTGPTKVGTPSITHRDQLVAVWIEQGATVQPILS